MLYMIDDLTEKEKDIINYFKITLFPFFIGSLYILTKELDKIVL